MKICRLFSGNAITLIAFICGFLFVCAPPAFSVETPFDVSSCQLKALATADNDLRLDRDDRLPGKAVLMPAPVVSQVRAAAKGLLARARPGTVEEVTCKRLFRNTYRISEPEHRQLFVSRIYVAYGSGFFYLILYDPVTGAVTEHPPHIWAPWTDEFGVRDELVKTPFVSSSDLFQNHQPQIVFEERVHNGTMYNAVIYHYFDIGPKLSMTRVFARETRLLALNPYDGIFVRELRRLSPSHLRLDTLKVGDSRASTTPAELGYVLLESPGPGAPFRVMQRHPRDPRKFDCLVTCMDGPPSDDVFLREGNPFYY
jgi:hypothetical protein